MAFSISDILTNLSEKTGIANSQSKPNTDTNDETNETKHESQFYEKFIHPDDKIASDKLKAIPMFDKIVSKIMDLGLDQAIYTNNMISFIHITPKQLPDLYHCTAHICEKLKIDVPNLFLDLSSEIPAHVSGLSQTSLVFGKPLLRFQDDTKIQNAIISRQCGHLFCRNCMYRTLVEYLINYSELILSVLPGALLTGMKVAMNTWYRKSELSADRVAAAVCGNAETVITSELTVANSSQWLVKNIDIESWAGQIDTLEEIGKENTKDSIVNSILQITNSHAISAIRVREILKWSKTDEFAHILSQLDSGNF